MIFWNTSRFRIYVICTFEVWNMACARVHTNDRWEEKLMDGCGLGSPAVCVVILLLGHCPPPRPPFCPPPCPTPPPPLSSSIFTSQLTSLSTSLSTPLAMDWNLLPSPSSGIFPDFLEKTSLKFCSRKWRRWTIYQLVSQAGTKWAPIGSSHFFQLQLIRR